MMLCCLRHTLDMSQGDKPGTAPDPQQLGRNSGMPRSQPKVVSSARNAVVGDQLHNSIRKGPPLARSKSLHRNFRAEHHNDNAAPCNKTRRKECRLEAYHLTKRWCFRVKTAKATICDCHCTKPMPRRVKRPTEREATLRAPVFSLHLRRCATYKTYLKPKRPEPGFARLCLPWPLWAPFWTPFGGPKTIRHMLRSSTCEIKLFVFNNIQS